ncbi:carbohydrate kinase family protein [Cohnella soli]|uniref:Carbohydrate kinase family protein n=1 Tax=Cohnella soli TaxID=425005 RepID=A0ABW0I208_9BACL
MATNNGNTAALETEAVKIAVCGHIAVDIIPRIDGHERSEDGFRLTPGSLSEVAEATFSTGGAVSNTGIALHRLGADVRLIGKVSDDYFGELTLRLLKEVNPVLGDDVALVEGETSSYTIVINPPGVDRIFLHCPGTNDTFTEEDIRWEELRGTQHFHFGYPPLMKSMYADGGDRLAGILKSAKDRGMSVSLDMAMPGRETAAYSADWLGILSKALPYVDLFMPSLEEMLMMVDRAYYEELAVVTDEVEMALPVETIRGLAERLLGMGCGAVVLKLGSSGLYMRTDDRRSLTEWNNRELWSPCFRTNVAGTTGAGDSTIAGFLFGFVRQLGPEATMTGAAAVGACSVERLDATSGITPWGTVQNRIASGWERLPIERSLADWCWEQRYGIWVGPADKGIAVE